MRQATLCFVLYDNRVLLGFKKRGFGSSKYAGFGGKLEPGESPQEGVVREVWEECGVSISEEDLMQKGELTFIFPFKPEWDMLVHVFSAKKWSGDPSETEEMKPRWFELSSLPYAQMWDDYKHWFPRILNGEVVKATFYFKEDNKHVANFKIFEHNF